MTTALLETSAELVRTPVTPRAEPHSAPALDRANQPGVYRLRLAASTADRLAACRLRFLVFNLELNEGLEAAYRTGYDEDEYDAQCDHLLVEHAASGQVVGTYRLQTCAMARANRGFYSEQEFRFEPYAALGDRLVELGRACIHRDHRATGVLELLWKGVMQYAGQRGARYLIGCSSLHSQNPAHGAGVYRRLRAYEVEPCLRTVPQDAYAMPPAATECASEEVPKLLRTYLALGAKICGPPAMDREFRTLDFLTLMDLDSLHPRIRARFMKF